LSDVLTIQKSNLSMISRIKAFDRMPYSLPPTFTICVRQIDADTYQLSTSQMLPVPPKQAFTFFEDPRNLFDITPDWLQFVMKDREMKTKVFEGAEFDYTIQWYGVTMEWKSRIIGYKPPERFVDVQLVGPYRYWEHLHAFDDVTEGTRMRDIVTYKLPFGMIGRMIHALVVRRQLNDIFSYRAVRINEWTKDELRKKVK
jgi:ligand-binding SRPBCC domain-containing protein